MNTYTCICAGTDLPLHEADRLLSLQTERQLHVQHLAVRGAHKLLLKVLIEHTVPGISGRGHQQIYTE